MNKRLGALVSQTHAIAEIPLEETSAVGLLDRYDTKYLMSFQQLHAMLERCSSHYLVTSAGSTRVFLYKNLYLDTPRRSMYLDHHNGKTLRYKIRLREYAGFDLVYLEVKEKYKGKTGKYRLKLEGMKNISQCLADHSVREKMGEFIERHSPYCLRELQPVFRNRYYRITLVHRSRQERITIDSLLSAFLGDREKHINDLVIAEIKHHGRRPSLEFAKLLKQHRIYPDGYSKYCLGSAELHHDIKYNAFKETQRKAERIAYGLVYY